MNDIGQKTVETYVRNLISKDFSSKTSHINRRDRQRHEGAHEAPSHPPKSKVTQRDKIVLMGDEYRNLVLGQPCRGYNEKY
jgi:hypothetical protein